ncbi:MAG TPA: carboxypeptidase-like regulatory domain-containing protein, partial [Bacteroidia bacterium]|nr:carboxypeptidase-like regulatory domain-containing protein [Bacteroidia bacterium]
MTLAQSYSVKGSLYERDKSPVIGASVILLNPKDSSFIKGTTSNESGLFVIENVTPKSYILKVSYLGYNDYFKSVSINDNLTLDAIQLRTGAKKLQEV